jgi:hypothetical protein
MPSTQTAVKYFSPSTSIIEHPEDANSDFLVTGAAVVGCGTAIVRAGLLVSHCSECREDVADNGF